MSSRELVKVATLSMCLGVVYSKSQNKKLLTSNTLSLPIKSLLFVSFFVFPLFLFTKLFFSCTSRPTPTRQQKNHKEKVKQKKRSIFTVYITYFYLYYSSLSIYTDIKVYYRSEKKTMTKKQQTSFYFTLSMVLKPASHFQKFTLKRKEMKSTY